METRIRDYSGKYYVVISTDQACGPWGNIPVEKEFHPSAAERFAKEILARVKQCRDAERMQVKRFWDPGYSGPKP